MKNIDILRFILLLILSFRHLETIKDISYRNPKLSKTESVKNTFLPTAKSSLSVFEGEGNNRYIVPWYNFFMP